MKDQPDVYKTLSRLLKAELKIAAITDSPEKEILKREIEKARAALGSGDIRYAEMVADAIRPSIRRLRIYQFLIPETPNSNIQLILRGIILYSFIILLLGICVVVVYSYDKDPTGGLITFVKKIGLDPLFKTVISLGIKPEAYFLGLFGGAGAVVSLVRRFDELSKARGSRWLFFSTGLFNPIAGSLAAVVICQFATGGATGNLKSLPLTVIAFFSGFSERLLNNIGEKLSK